MKEGRKGYEEVAYLLLFGKLPDAGQLADFEGSACPGTHAADQLSHAMLS